MTNCQTGVYYKGVGVEGEDILVHLPDTVVALGQGLRLGPRRTGTDSQSRAF